MTILYALLILFVAELVTTITSLYELTILLFTYHTQVICEIIYLL